MTNDLARFSAGDTKTHTIGNGVQTTFQQLQQVLTSLTATTICLGVDFPELALEHTVQTTDLLLFAQLHAITRHTLT